MLHRHSLRRANSAARSDSARRAPPPSESRPSRMSSTTTSEVTGAVLRAGERATRQPCFEENGTQRSALVAHAPEQRCNDAAAQRRGKGDHQRQRSAERSVKRVGSVGRRQRRARGWRGERPPPLHAQPLVERVAQRPAPPCAAPSAPRVAAGCRARCAAMAVLFAAHQLGTITGSHSQPVLGSVHVDLVANQASIAALSYVCPAESKR